MDAIKTACQQELRSILGTHAPKGAKSSTLDKLTAEVIAILAQRCGDSVSAWMQSMSNVAGNIETLGDKCVTTPAAKLAAQLDPELLRRMIEADVDERKVVDEFAPSEICDTCGLPKASNKINLNRMDVEDEVLGQQYDAVFNDCCRCVPGVTTSVTGEKAKADNKNDDDEDENADDKKEKAAPHAPQPAAKGSILSLFEEQDELDREDEQKLQQQKQQQQTAEAPQRRKRE